MNLKSMELVLLSVTSLYRCGARLNQVRTAASCFLPMLQPWFPASMVMMLFTAIGMKLSNISRRLRSWFFSVTSKPESETIKALGPTASVILARADAIKMVTFAGLQTHSLAWSCVTGSRECKSRVTKWWVEHYQGSMEERTLSHPLSFTALTDFPFCLNRTRPQQGKSPPKQPMIYYLERPQMCWEPIARHSPFFRCSVSVGKWDSSPQRWGTTLSQNCTRKRETVATATTTEHFSSMQSRKVVFARVAPYPMQRLAEML